MKTESEFRKWFEAQYGKRPSRKSHSTLFREFDDAAYVYFNTKRNMNAADNWDANFRIALTAWCARDKKKARK